MPVHIRLIEDKDWNFLPALMGALHDYVGAMYEFLPPWSEARDEYIPLIKKKLTALGGELYVAEKDSALVGYIIYWIEQSDDPEYKASHRPFGYIKDIYVAPETQGSGAGKQLMEKALAHFRQHNVKLAQLHVVPQNLEAQEFYKRLGFEFGAMQMLKEL